MRVTDAALRAATRLPDRTHIRDESGEPSAIFDIKTRPMLRLTRQTAVVMAHIIENLGEEGAAHRYHPQSRDHEPHLDSLRCHHGRRWRLKTPFSKAEEAVAANKIKRVQNPTFSAMRAEGALRGWDRRAGRFCVCVCPRGGSVFLRIQKVACLRRQVAQY